MKCLVEGTALGTLAGLQTCEGAKETLEQMNDPVGLTWWRFINLIKLLTPMLCL